MMVILTDAGWAGLLDPTKVTHLVSLLAQSMVTHWVLMMERLTEMHLVQLTETSLAQLMEI